MTQTTHQPDLSQDNVVQPENAAEGTHKGAGFSPDDEDFSPDKTSSAAPSDPAATIEALKTEAAGFKDQLLRTLAEMDNLRKRTDREKEDTAKYAVTAFARDILAVADNLRRAIETIPAEEREQLGDTLRGLVAGVEMTEKDLATTLGRHGVKAVTPLNEAFDPHLHQAMFEVPGSGKPAGTVVQVLQSGYTLHGRLLRPALVGVAKNGPAEAVSEPQKT